MICPKTGHACCDDLCHGAGCLEMDGYPMLAECSHCGGLIDEEIPDCSTCTCDEGEEEVCGHCGNSWSCCECSLDYPKTSEATP